MIESLNYNLYYTKICDIIHHLAVRVENSISFFTLPPACFFLNFYIHLVPAVTPHSLWNITRT